MNYPTLDLILYDDLQNICNWFSGNSNLHHNVYMVRYQQHF